MVLAHTSVLPCGRMSSPKWLLPASVFQLPSASPGGSPRSASRSNSGSFKLLLLPWVLDCVRFCVHPLRAESLFPQPFCSAGLQSQMCWWLLFLVQVPQAGEPVVGLNPSPLGEESCNCDYPPILGLTGGVGLNNTVSNPPTYLTVIPSLYL